MSDKNYAPVCGIYCGIVVTLGINARVVAIWTASHSGLHKSLPVFALSMIVAGIRSTWNIVVYAEIFRAGYSWSLEIQA